MSSNPWKSRAAKDQDLRMQLDKRCGRQLAVLHDRSVPSKRFRFDHLVVAPTGIYVLQVKHYVGRAQAIVGTHDSFETDPGRLFVGQQDCTHIVSTLERQAQWVREILANRIPNIDVSVTPVLCLMNVQRRRFGRPLVMGNTWVVGPKTVLRATGWKGSVRPAAIHSLVGTLDRSCPPH